jgi:D-alanyl-D-alanine carboxypeptidase (penicillin-binding protein 5/6)
MEKMKNHRKIFFTLLNIFLLVALFPARMMAAALPQVNAAAAIVIDTPTGAILYQQNAFVLRAPASTTKILTTILAIECGELDDLVTVSKNAAAVGEASVNLVTNDQLTLRELLYGALLQSGNDACVAIAEHISSCEEEYIGLMNLKAQVIGAHQTTFYNTNGLPHAGHLTTAYDLALITRYAMQNPVFRQIVQTKDHVMRWTFPRKTKYLKNTNRLLWSYPYATGVKTGTTIKAGKCLVASASYGRENIIAVVLDSPNRFGDAQRLLDYGIRVKETQANAN